MYLKKIELIIKNPVKFFSQAKKEKNLKDAFFYYGFLSIVSMLGISLIYFLAYNYSLNIPYGTYLGVPMQDFNPITTYIFTLINIFISSFIVHIFVRLLKGKGNYADSFKAFAYGSTPSLLLGWVPGAGIVFSLWSIYLIIKGLSILHKMSMVRALVAALMIFVVLIVISILLAGVAYFYISSLLQAQPI